MKAIFHPAAEEEYQNAVAYYRNFNFPLGERFYLEMERLVAGICAAPFLYREIDPPVRRRLSSDFPYAILYVPQDIQIVVLSVMHLRREPDYWKGRL